jgi:general secretion pathway protein G
MRLAKTVSLLAVAAWLAGCDIGPRMNGKEIKLKDDLFTLRKTIDEYTYDRKKAPQSLDDLVRKGYLKQIPSDPITGRADWNPTMEADVQNPQEYEIGIIDIHSSSDQASSDGTRYSSW